MRNLLAVTMFAGVAACSPNERVDTFELGAACDVGEPISECADFEPMQDSPGTYVQSAAQARTALGMPVQDVRVRVTDGLVTRVVAEFDLDFCPAVDARLHDQLGNENRVDLNLSHWRGTAFQVDLDFPVDRPICSVAVAERSLTRPFSSP